MGNIMKNKKIVAIIGIAILIATFAFIVYVTMDMSNNKNYTNNDNNNSSNNTTPKEDNNKEEEEQVISIVDTNSNSRSVAVMINNLNAARKYHSGLQDAYIVYEMIVEGGITRMMAIYKGKDTARIGSIRSARHYFLDYALENDAIYVHYGWSPKAQSDISSLKVKNINGLYDDAFWRDNSLNVAYEHTAFTSMSNILKVAKKKGYSMSSNKDLLLNYSADEIDLTSVDGSITANSVDIKYSNYVTTNYIYNPTDKVYYRSVNDSPHKDYVTKKQYYAKNIIIAYIDNYNLSGDTSGRQDLDNIGSGSGYYVTSGKAVPITWTKSSRSSQTVYKYRSGEEITVNDGNTFIQIAPLKSATIK